MPSDVGSLVSQGYLENIVRPLVSQRDVFVICHVIGAISNFEIVLVRLTNGIMAVMIVVRWSRRLSRKE